MRLSRFILRFSSSAQEAKAIKAAPEFPTFSEMIDHIAKHKQLKENTLADFIQITAFVNASLIPNTRNDLDLQSEPNFPLLNNVKLTSEDLTKLNKILIDNSNRLGFYRAELPLKTLAQYLQAMEALSKLDIRPQAKSILKARLSSLVSFESLFSVQLSVEPSLIKIHNVNYLLVLAAQMKQWHIFNMLLHLLLKKDSSFKVDTFRSLTMILNSVDTNTMYEIEAQNFKYFVRNWYYRTLFKRIVPVIESESAGIPENDKIVILTSVLMVFKHASTTSKGLLQNLLGKLAGWLKKDMTPSDKRRLLLNYLKILSDVGQNKLKLAQSANTHKVFAQHASFVTPWENLKMAHAMMLLEVSGYFDLAPWKQSSARPEFWRLERFAVPDFSIVVSDDVYLSFLGNVTPQFVKTLNIQFVRTLLQVGLFLHNFKRLEHPVFADLPRMEERLGQQLSSVNNSNFQTSTMLLHLQKLLLERPDITIEREKRIAGGCTDYLISYKDNKKTKFILELDGPVHYMSHGDLNSNTKLRNFLLLCKGYKVVNLQLEYFSTIVAMQKEHELINDIFNEIETTQLLLVGWPATGRAQDSEKGADGHSDYSHANDLLRSFDPESESTKNLWG